MAHIKKEMALLINTMILDRECPDDDCDMFPFILQ